MSGLFADRHIGTDAPAQKQMLAALGYPSVDALVDAAIPAGIRLPADAPTTLPPAAP